MDQDMPAAQGQSELRRTDHVERFAHPELHTRSGAISVQEFMIFMRRLEVDMGKP